MVSKVGLASGATYSVTSVDGVTDEAAAAALERCFGLGDFEGAGECSETVESLVGQIVMSQAYGFGLVGEAWEAIDGLYYPTQLNPIYADSIVGWHRDETGAVDGAIQRVRGRSGETTIPLDEVIYAVRMPGEGGSEGVALLRPIFPKFDAWLGAIRARDVVVQKYAVPSMFARWNFDVLVQLNMFILPDNPTDIEKETQRKEMQDEIDSFDAMLAEYTSHQRGRIVPPPFFDIVLIGGSEQADPTKLTPLIESSERAMLETLGFGWLTIGRPGSGGSLSLVVQQRAASFDTAKSDNKWALKAINDQLVARFMRFNFSNVPRVAWPRIDFAMPSASAFIAQFDKVVAGIAAGVITPNTDDEARFRQGFELGPMDDDAEARSTTDRMRGLAISTASAVATATRESAADIARAGRARNQTGVADDGQG